jgi:signal peptidase
MFVRRLGRVVRDAALVSAVLGFLFLAVGPHLLPYRTVTMLTGSMRPLIPPGAVAVDVREPVSALRAGQIISFHAPEAGNPVVTHRVVSVQRRNGQVLIRTRGIANSANDPWVAVVHGNDIWRVRAVVPHLGDGIRLLRSRGIHLLVAWLVPAALLLWFLTGVWRPRKVENGGEPECSEEPASAPPPSSVQPSCVPARQRSARRSRGRQKRRRKAQACKRRRQQSARRKR